MADVKYYDFNEFQNVNGNPDLERAFIRNYDVRLEVFPGPAEVLAVSYFYKDLEDAIEIKLIPEPTRFVRTWFNSPNGKNYGYEIEMRQGLGFLGGFLNDVMVTMNYTRVTSEIEYVDKKTASDGSHIIRTLTRPMQGQAPWMMNAGVMVTTPFTGTTFNILFNKIGRRLVSVGDSRYEDVYEEPRNVIDIAVTQRISNWLGAKFTVQDVAGDDLVHTMGPSDFRGPHSTISKSSTYGLSLSFRL
jgi:outer membrane receptor protein involved in Fe transport